MSYLYICTLMFLGIAFMCYKKSDKQLNFVKWICIFAVGILGYNVTVCMILGVLHIVQNIWLLSAINTIIGTILIYKPIKNREFQKYKCSKMDAVTILLICVVFGVMFVKDLYIFKGDVTHWAIDSAIHYRAAEQYSEELQLFVFAEDKTFFNFNIMQTGAYINDGIFMNVINSITGIEKIYLFQVFETLVMFASGLALYTCFADKIKTKRGLFGTIILFALYMYGYPYNSWTYGFSYLSVGIAMTTLLLPLVQMIFSEENIKKSFAITMVVITSMGLIFSYCLFVPAVFASICIYVLLEDLKDKNTKKYLKLFGKNTLIVIGLLLLVTAFGIGYLFIPSFIIEGQQNLISALKEEGGIYPERYMNFIPYIPFALIFCAEFIKKLKNQSLKFLDIFSVCIIGFLALLWIGMSVYVVSQYYMLKLYFITWVVIFAVTIDILNNNIDNKMFSLAVILGFALLPLLFIAPLLANRFFPRTDGIPRTYNVNLIFQIYLVLSFVMLTVFPDGLKPKKDFRRIKVTPLVYVIILGIFISGYTWVKSGHILSEFDKHSLPNLIGIYYIENCEHRKAVDVTQNFNENNILITKFAKENLEDMTADNTTLLTEWFYRTMWAMATLEYDGEYVTFRDVLNSTNQHNIKEAIENPNMKYIIRLDSREKSKIDECKEDLEELEQIVGVEILYSNENGYVAKINR